MDWGEYRQLQEQAVSNLSGGSAVEVHAVTGVVTASVFVLACVNPQQGRWIAELLLLVAPCILALLLPQSIPFVLVVFALVLCIFPPPRRPLPVKASPRRPFITCFRASCMLLTVISILAVDFRLFPRRFAKTEAVGVSVMDAGVGSTVFSMGLSAGSRGRHTVPRPAGVLRRVLPMLLIGVLRSVFVKAAQYQEHVTEYGVHWNFFLTLAVVVAADLLAVRRFQRASGVAGLVMLGLYEAALQLGVAEYVHGPRRDTFFAKNKEGILSCIGYLSIHLVSVRIGHGIATEPRLVVLRNRLAALSAIGYLAYALLDGLFSTSRRLANAGYCMWVVALCTGHLAALGTAELWVGSRLHSIVMDVVNAHQLALFLLANLATGAINLAMQTLLASDAVAVLVVLAYTIALLSVMQLYSHYGRMAK